MKPSPPDFRSPAFLQDHILHTMAFYDGRCLDPSGGFFHFFKDDGTIYDRTTRHLVSSTRFVVTHAMAAQYFTDHPRSAAWRDAARHGLRFLRNVHRNPATGGYAWMLRFEDGRSELLDDTNHCYGLAFVLLAHAQALKAGIEEARAGLDETVALMEEHFWEPLNSLYADEASADWTLTPYRGQNANMHACEAFIAAYEATGEERHLNRACLIAESVTECLAEPQGGLIWEHYCLADDGTWTPDWDYNRADSSNIFRPWGYQVGHFTEWAKLLLTLQRLRPGNKVEGDADPPLVHRARGLFATAVDHGWDRLHGGLVYGFGPEDPDVHPHKLVVCDAHKYFWVQAESIAASAMLATQTAGGGYWTWYDHLWAYSWRHFVDHEHGAWYRILTHDHKKIDDLKSPAGKVDYHTMGACYEVLAALAR